MFLIIKYIIVHNSGLYLFKRGLSMAIKIDKSIIDIIPVIENNDAKIIYDHGLVKFNKIILGVFNQLQMEQGTMEDYPDMGCFDYLLNIYFSESQNGIINQIRDNLKTYQNEEINIDIVKDDYNSKCVSIVITVENIPNLKFTADLVRENNSVKIVKPNVIEV